MASKYQGGKMNPSRFSTSQLKFYFLLIPIALFMLLPLVYIFNHSLKPLDELFAYPPRFFVEKPTFQNFIRLFSAGSSTYVPMSRYLLNSLIVTVLTILCNWVVTIMAAYVLSKKRRYRFTGIISKVNETALMFCSTAVAIPTYIIMDALGLINSFWSNILPLIAMPVGLFLVKQFMDQAPDELIEAAVVDGANDFQILWSIVVPIIKPAIATVGILTFQAVWNNTATSTLYIQQESLKTFAYYLNTLTMSTTGNTIIGVGMQAASTVIIFMPNLIIFILLQSQVMDTMASSGIK